LLVVLAKLIRRDFALELSLPLFSWFSLFALSLNLISALYQSVSLLPRFAEKPDNAKTIILTCISFFLSSVELQLSVGTGLRMLSITELTTNTTISKEEVISGQYTSEFSLQLSCYGF